MRAQSCPILCDPMDCTPPGSFAHGDFPVKNTGWVLFPPPGESSQPRDQAHISCLLHWQADSLPLAALAVAQRFSSIPRACGILVPWPGIKPESPVLQGRFLTTGQPGKSQFLKKKKQQWNRAGQIWPSGHSLPTRLNPFFKKIFIFYLFGWVGS